MIKKENLIKSQNTIDIDLEEVSKQLTLAYNVYQDCKTTFNKKRKYERTMFIIAIILENILLFFLFVKKII